MTSSALTSSPSLTRQLDQPARAAGAHLGKRIPVDQQDPLAMDLGRNAIKYRERHRGGANGEEGAQVDPTMDRRHPDQTIQLVKRNAGPIRRRTARRLQTVAHRPPS